MFSEKLQKQLSLFNHYLTENTPISCSSDLIFFFLESTIFSQVGEQAESREFDFLMGLRICFVQIDFCILITF